MAGKQLGLFGYQGEVSKPEPYRCKQPRWKRPRGQPEHKGPLHAGDKVLMLHAGGSFIVATFLCYNSPHFSKAYFRFTLAGDCEWDIDKKKWMGKAAERPSRLLRPEAGVIEAMRTAKKEKRSE